jgi:hypothetical protein
MVLGRARRVCFAGLHLYDEWPDANSTTGPEMIADFLLRCTRGGFARVWILQVDTDGSWEAV